MSQDIEDTANPRLGCAPARLLERLGFLTGVLRSYEARGQNRTDHEGGRRPPRQAAP
jgi:hypothetical protein